MSAEPEPYECEYCGDECEQLFLIVDDFPGTWYEPPHRDEIEVCRDCYRKLEGWPDEYSSRY